MKTIILLSFFMFIIGGLFSQPWMDKFEKSKSLEKVNFYDIQESFNQYWEPFELKGAKYLKNGKWVKAPGWKQYKRWEAFMEPRVYPSGYINQTAQWTELQKKSKRLKGAKASNNANWSVLGPIDVPLDFNGNRSGIGRINCIAFHPTDENIIWIGAPSGGLWKTKDGGQNWTTTTDNFTTLGVSDIAVHPTNPDIIYIATGDGDASDTYSFGILKSQDGGETFTPTGFNPKVHQRYTVRRLLINPNDPTILIAATNGGVYRTTDGGDSWDEVVDGIFKDLEFQPNNPNVVYAARYTTAKIYKSTDAGATFSIVLDDSHSDFDGVKRIELAVTPADANKVYAVCSNSSDNGFNSFWTSSDAGDTWNKSNFSNNLLGWYDGGADDTGGQGWYDLTLTVAPDNVNHIFVGGVNIWKSLNGGTSWSLVGHWYGGYGAEYVHADHHWTSYSPKGVLFNGNDGGIYKSTDGGYNWTDISDGILITQVDRMSTSATEPNTITIGNQDNGTMRYKDGVWNDIYGGDGCETIIDYTDASIMYASYIRGDIKRSYDYGQSWTAIKPDGAGSGAWHTPYIIDPKDHKTLYAGFDKVYKTTDQGDTWTATSSSFTGGDLLSQLAISKSDPSVIYASTGSDSYCSQNGGASWGGISNDAPLSGKYVTYFAVHPEDPKKVWVTVSGYDDGQKVYYSDDYGVNWVNMSEGLPNVPANCIVYQEGSNDALYVGTDIGVYYRDASMNTWEDFSNKLPNVVISELEINSSTGKIRAGTRGRGVWESDIYAQYSLDATVSTITSPNEAYCENTAVFTPTVEIYNKGNQVLTSFAVSYQIDNETPVSKNWTGTLNQGDKVSVSFNEITLQSGTYNFTTKVENPNGSNDENTANDSKTLQLNIGGVSIPYSEDFSDKQLPRCWNNVEGNGLVWRFDNPESREFFSKTHDNGFVILDSDYYGSETNQNADLITPKFDFSAYSVIFVKFNHYFRQYQSNSTATFSYSDDGGKTWVQIDSWTTSTSNAEEYIKDVSDLVAGKSSIRFKWNYTGSDGFYWAIDDIYIEPNEITDIEELKDAGIQIYPNPSDGKVNITSANKKIESVKLLDVNGKELNLIINNNRNVLTIDLQNQSSGVYFIKILIDEKSFVTKVIRK